MDISEQFDSILDNFVNGDLGQIIRSSSILLDKCDDIIRFGFKGLRILMICLTTKIRMMRFENIGQIIKVLIDNSDPDCNKLGLWLEYWMSSVLGALPEFYELSETDDFLIRFSFYLEITRENRVDYFYEKSKEFTKPDILNEFIQGAYDYYYQRIFLSVFQLHELMLRELIHYQLYDKKTELKIAGDQLTKSKSEINMHYVCLLLSNFDNFENECSMIKFIFHKLESYNHLKCIFEYKYIIDWARVHNFKCKEIKLLIDSEFKIPQLYYDMYLTSKTIDINNIDPNTPTIVIWDVLNYLFDHRHFTKFVDLYEKFEQQILILKKIHPQLFFNTLYQLKIIERYSYVQDDRFDNGYIFSLLEYEIDLSKPFDHEIILDLIDKLHFFYQ